MELGCDVLSWLPGAGESCQCTAAFTALIFLAEKDKEVLEMSRWIQVIRILSSLVRGRGGSSGLRWPQLITSQLGKPRLTKSHVHGSESTLYQQTSR